MYFSRSNLNISTVRYFCHLSKDYHHKETKFSTYISNNKRGPLKTRKKIVTNLYNAFSWFKKCWAIYMSYKYMTCIMNKN